jgi:hypothetical protein
MRKWGLRIGIAVVGLVVLALIAGSLLPREHEAWQHATYRASPDVVFATVTDFEKYPQWRTGVSRVDVNRSDPAGLLVTEHNDHGVIPYRVEVLERPSKVVTRIADPDLGFGGTWTYEIRPNDSGSELVITERGEISNPIFRLMGKLFFSPTATIETYLADLKKRLGE